MKANSFNLDPRTKIFITITISIILMSGGSGPKINIVKLCLTVLPLLFLVLYGESKKALNFIMVYFLAYLGQMFLMPITKGLLNFIIAATIGIITRMLPGIVMGYFLVSSTNVSEFTASMERMGVTTKVVIPMSVMFRFFPTIKEEARDIKNAMKMRGILGPRIITEPLKSIEYGFVPLLMSCVKIGEELSIASLTRGLGGNVKRTNICDIGFTLWDFLFFIISMVCWVFFILGR